MNRVDFIIAKKLILHPAKITLAVVQDENGNNNLITLEWFMRTSIKPPMFAISIGHTRYSYECLQKVRKFNLCFPSKKMKELAIFCGSKSGRDLDKFETNNVEWFKGRWAQLPILKNAVANFECEVVSQVRSGDHTIFVGEVKYSWIDSNEEVLLAEDLNS